MNAAEGLKNQRVSPGEFAARLLSSAAASNHQQSSEGLIATTTAQTGTNRPAGLAMSKARPARQHADRLCPSSAVLTVGRLPSEARGWLRRAALGSSMVNMFNSEH